MAAMASGDSGSARYRSWKSCEVFLAAYGTRAVHVFACGDLSPGQPSAHAAARGWEISLLVWGRLPGAPIHEIS